MRCHRRPPLRPLEPQRPLVHSAVQASQLGERANTFEFCQFTCSNSTCDEAVGQPKWSFAFNFVGCAKLQSVIQCKPGALAPTTIFPGPSQTTLVIDGLWTKLTPVGACRDRSGYTRWTLQHRCGATVVRCDWYLLRSDPWLWGWGFATAGFFSSRSMQAANPSRNFGANTAIEPKHRRTTWRRALGLSKPCISNLTSAQTLQG